VDEGIYKHVVAFFFYRTLCDIISEVERFCSVCGKKKRVERGGGRLAGGKGIQHSASVDMVRQGRYNVNQLMRETGK